MDKTVFLIMEGGASTHNSFEIIEGFVPPRRVHDKCILVFQSGDDAALFLNTEAQKNNMVFRAPNMIAAEDHKLYLYILQVPFVPCNEAMDLPRFLSAQSQPQQSQQPADQAQL